ncbi:hypothetical protein [Streptomyces sp. SYSU K217416]
MLVLVPVFRAVAAVLAGAVTVVAAVVVVAVVVMMIAVVMLVPVLVTVPVVVQGVVEQGGAEQPESDGGDHEAAGDAEPGQDGFAGQVAEEVQVSTRPSITWPAKAHRDTVFISGHSIEAARWAAAITETASDSGEAAGSGITGSSANATRATVKYRRTSSDLRRNRLIQPRTVPSARPRRAATWRCPSPRAAISSPVPITSAAATTPPAAARA